MHKSQVVSHLAAKAGIQKRAAAVVLDELATLTTKKSKVGGPFVNPGLAKAAKTTGAKRVSRFRRASADSDEVFATLAKAFSSL